MIQCFNINTVLALESFSAFCYFLYFNISPSNILGLSLVYKKNEQMYKPYFYMSHRGVDCRHCTMWLPEPFLSALQKVIFCSGFKYFFMMAVIFCILKNYCPMQIFMSAVVGVDKFGQEFLIIGIFEIFCTNTSNKI